MFFIFSSKFLCNKDILLFITSLFFFCPTYLQWIFKPVHTQHRKYASKKFFCLYDFNEKGNND